MAADNFYVAEFSVFTNRRFENNRAFHARLQRGLRILWKCLLHDRGWIETAADADGRLRRGGRVAFCFGNRWRRRRQAASSPAVTVVLPTELWVPAMSRRAFTVD